jgi:hypothetical protein
MSADLIAVGLTLAYWSDDFDTEKPVLHGPTQHYWPGLLDYGH